MKDAARDARYMAAALRLAAKGRGTTSPNPMVGAVVVSGHRVVGQAYHRRAGEPHAEVLALKAAGPPARHATLYVTLEPCCHTDKRTPPCVPAVIASGVRRVVVAMLDPNPKVNGQGIRQLRRAGLDVAVGCLRERAECLNAPYVHWSRTGRPFVLLKAAMTLDGKIATAVGESRWITDEPARRDAHRLRRRMDAVMVGVGTVLQDDPALTARTSTGFRAGRPVGPQPIRVIVDSRLRMPPGAKVVTASSSSPTIVVTTTQAPRYRIAQLEKRGATVLVVGMDHGRVSLRACLTRLGKMGVTSVLLEGGSELNAAFLRAGLVDRMRFYVAPMILGGQDAKGVIGGRSPKRLADALKLKDLRLSRAGRDLVVDAIPQR